MFTPLPETIKPSTSRKRETHVKRRNDAAKWKNLQKRDNRGQGSIIFQQNV